MLRCRRSLHKPLKICSRFYSSRFAPVEILDGHLEDIDKLDLREPVVFPKRFTDLPAIAKWFRRVDCSPDHNVYHDLDSTYLSRHGSSVVPLELTRHHGVEGLGARTTTSFKRFEAPLSLLLSHLTTKDHSQQLYLAQCALDDLPSELQHDLPTPDLVFRIGRGDIYASSLWMGQPPTSTPLHRDPNPNLFVQLVGKKVVRLVKPKQGRSLYERLRTSSGYAHMRGEEMMIGEERDRLHRAVWGEEEIGGVSASGVEATLGSGDGLYIPIGWWHAVESYGTHPSASVNWWFR